MSGSGQDGLLDGLVRIENKIEQITTRFNNTLLTAVEQQQAILTQVRQLAQGNDRILGITEELLKKAATLDEHIAELRAGIMARIDRLQLRVDQHADRILGAVQLAKAADATGNQAAVTAMEGDLAAMRRVNALSEMVGKLLEQVARLEEQVRHLEDGRSS